MGLTDIPTKGDITRILAAWRSALAANMVPLPVSDLVAGDTVFGHIEEDLLGTVRVVMYGEPFTIERIDDTFWRQEDGSLKYRRLHSPSLPAGETNLSPDTRVLVVKAAT